MGAQTAGRSFGRTGTGLVLYGVVGALLGGVLGAGLGLLVPLVAVSGNMDPLMGFVYGGPIGIVVGAVIGALLALRGGHR